MNQFLMSERLGDNLETMFQTIYMGGGTNFGIYVTRLIYILGRLADAGMLTNMTRRRIEVFLTKNVNVENLEIISKKSNDIVLINTEIHEQEAFKLTEYITWITEELCNDPLMKKHLCERSNYQGVKAVLNTYADIKNKPVKKKDWLDFRIYDNKVYFTKRNLKSIHLFVKEIEEEMLPFAGALDESEEILLAKEGLLDGRIYAYLDGTIFVETELRCIIRIKDLGKGKCMRSKFEGHILGQLNDGRLVYINEGKLICLDVNGGRQIITKNAHLGFACIGDNEVYWKSDFRKYDIESSSCDNNIETNSGTIEECLKEEKICKEMLWKGLLLTLYDFDSMEFYEKIGNRLRFAQFFDRVPMPFTINKIGLMLSDIETCCYDGSIVKADGYVEVMSLIIALEKKELGEKETVKTLVHMFENMKRNPYAGITNNEGTKILNCFDYILGDGSLFEDESVETDNYDVDISDSFLEKLVSYNEDELDRLIEQKIAELEELVEEERKEAEKGIKANKKGKRSKNPVMPNGCEVERIAEGNKKPLGE